MIVMNTEQPFVIRRGTPEGESAYAQLLRDEPHTHIVNEYAEANRELQLLADPSFLLQDTANLGKDFTDADGVWIYYPWKKTLVHTLSEDAFTAVRISRNHNLILKEEEEILSRATIAIAGLNVGNPGALCLAQEGVGKKFSFADNDVLGLSNLNRFRAGLPDLGVNKAVLSARQAYEINPYLNIAVYPLGVNPNNLDAFLKDANVLIEEMDALPLKILIREEAKKRRMPVIMVTGNGHDLILDVERYDREPDLPLLSGKLKESVREKIAVGPRSFHEKVALARDFMGSEILAPRLNSSFDGVGKTLIGIPQLAEATFLRGAVLAHAVRSILTNDERVKSGRYRFGLSDLFLHRDE